MKEDELKHLWASSWVDVLCSFSQIWLQNWTIFSFNQKVTGSCCCSTDVDGGGGGYLCLLLSENQQSAPWFCWRRAVDCSAWPMISSSYKLPLLVTVVVLVHMFHSRVLWISPGCSVWTAAGWWHSVLSTDIWTVLVLLVWKSSMHLQSVEPEPRV